MLLVRSSLMSCLAAVAAAGLSGRGNVADPRRPVSARAEAALMDSAGRSVGSARLSARDGRLVIEVHVAGLRPGRHGVHLHAVGRCDRPSFATAGGHFNPTQLTHGLEAATGPHAGDLPNLDVDRRGRGRIRVVTDRASVTSVPSLLAGDGTAVVIHADPDDQRTDPSGKSGARIACGIVTRGS